MSGLFLYVNPIQNERPILLNTDHIRWADEIVAGYGFDHGARTYLRLTGDEEVLEITQTLEWLSSRLRAARERMEPLVAP